MNIKKIVALNVLMIVIGSAQYIMPAAYSDKTNFRRMQSAMMDQEGILARGRSRACQEQEGYVSPTKADPQYDCCFTEEQVAAQDAEREKAYQLSLIIKREEQKRKEEEEQQFEVVKAAYRAKEDARRAAYLASIKPQTQPLCALQ